MWYIIYMVIYLITNKIDGRQYVGQTVQSIKNRWKQHKCSKPKYNSAIHHAIKKYGADNFRIEVIDHCNSLEELNKSEQLWIVAFDTLAPNGYNLTYGGERPRFTEDVRIRLSVAHTSKRLSQTHKDNISKSSKKPKSKEHKKSMSLVRLGKKHPRKNHLYTAK